MDRHARLLSGLARLVIRGPEAGYVLGDLEESYKRDCARGMATGKASRRFLVNIVRSAASLFVARFRIRGVRLTGPSMLDVKLGWRMLRKNPVLATVSVLSLAIGIPVGMAPVHIIDAIDAPPPVERGDRLVGFRYAGKTGGTPWTTSYEFALWRETLTSYEGIAAFRQVKRNLAPQNGVGRAIAAAEVTSSALSLVGTRPLLGRTFEPADDAAGASPVVVLGYDVWRTMFDKAASVIGSTVQVSGIPHTVVGVMPEGFGFPVSESMWLLSAERSATQPGVGAALKIFGRLADGVSDDAAQREASAVHASMAMQFPEQYGELSAEVVPITALLSGSPKGGMGAIEGIGGVSSLTLFQVLSLVLLGVACANVGLLIFARTATRSSELTVRTALGASRGRIVGQIATEALVLSLLAAGVGLIIMHEVPNRMIHLMMPADLGGLPWWIDLGLTPMTVVRALVLAVLSATAAAVIPALRVTGKAVRENMQLAEGGGYGIKFGGIWSVLVIVDIAVAIASVGLVASLGTRLKPIATGEVMEGFRAEEFLSAQIQFSGGVGISAGDTAAAAASKAIVAAAQQRLIERLEAEPGVRGVAVADRLPRMDHSGTYIEIEGVATPRLVGVPLYAARARVDVNYFRALDQSALAGRSFHTADLEGDRPIVVNTMFADEFLSKMNPVGRRIRYLSGPERTPGPWREIVGMVGDLGINLIEPENGAAIYETAAPGELLQPYFAIHLSSDPAAFAPRLFEIAGDIDPGAVTRATPLDDVYPEDWYLMLGVGIGWILLLSVLLTLAASGIYAIMAFAVAQRTREIGIRSALGARAFDIAATIGKRAAFQLGVGALLGMPVAGLTYFWLRQDPSATTEAFMVALIPGCAITMLVALFACMVPLVRALRIAPTEAIGGRITS